MSHPKHHGTVFPTLSSGFLKTSLVVCPKCIYKRLLKSSDKALLTLLHGCMFQEQKVCKGLQVTDQPSVHTDFYLYGL